MIKTINKYLFIIVNNDNMILIILIKYKIFHFYKKLFLNL